MKSHNYKYLQTQTRPRPPYFVSKHN